MVFARRATRALSTAESASPGVSLAPPPPADFTPCLPVFPCPHRRLSLSLARRALFSSASSSSRTTASSIAAAASRSRSKSVGSGAGGPNKTRASRTHPRCSSNCISNSATFLETAGSFLPSNTNKRTVSGVGLFSASALASAAGPRSTDTGLGFSRNEVVLVVVFSLVSSSVVVAVGANFNVFSTRASHSSHTAKRFLTCSNRVCSISSAMSVSSSPARSRRSCNTSTSGLSSSSYSWPSPPSASASRASRSHSSAPINARTSVAAGSSNPNPSCVAMISLNVTSAPSSRHRSKTSSARTPHSFAFTTLS